MYDIYGNLLNNTENTDSILQNKKWLPVGDSITNNGSYRNALTTYKNLKEISGGHQGGRCVSYANGAEYCAIEKVGLIPNEVPDIITIALGVNDYNNNCPIGDISDNPDAQTEISYTFYGCYKKLLHLLWEKYNGLIPIVLMTPFHIRGFEAKNQLELKLSDYVEAIKKIGEYYSYPVFDAYSESGLPVGTLTDKTDNYFTNDGLHLNRMAGAYIAPKLAQCMEYAIGKYNIACTSMGQSAVNNELSVGESKNIYVTLNPAGTNTPVEWETSNENIVTVKGIDGQDFYGTITGIATGNAIVTAKCGTLSKTFNVTVS